MRVYSGHDRALVRRLLRGDQAAFQEFFDQQAPRLYRFALRRVGHDEDVAEEIVQRTLLKGISKLRTFRGEASLLTWLCTICRHEISRYYGASRRLAEREVRVDDVGGVRGTLELLRDDSSSDPETRLLRTELASSVRLTLDCLPGRYGDVLEWKYIEGLAVKEIAVRLATGRLAAQSLLARARKAFRKAFERR